MFNNFPYPFKKIIKDSNSFHNYYNNLILKNKLPLLKKSPSSLSIFQKNNEENNKYNNNELKIFSNINNIYHHFSPNKIILKPLSKRNFIYRDILSNANSSLFLNFSRNVLSPRRLKIVDMSNSNEEKSKINYNINFFDDYEKGFFPDIDYSNLKYNEYEIYQNKSIYENLIEEKIKYFKENKNENATIQLIKKFNYGKNKKEIHLIFESLTITLQDMSISTNLQDKGFKIHFPFALLPIFYYKGFEAFIKFISAVVRIENNFEKIIYEEEKIIDALNDIKDYQIKSDEEDKKNDYDYMDIQNDKPIHLRPPILKRNKNTLRFNYFIFFWVTNTRTFSVKITLPCIHLNILDNKIVINHFIDYELLLYLYKRNFLNWEYYIIKNLSSYSKFRNIFQQIDSISKIYDKTIFLKEPKTRINTFEEELLLNVYTDQFNKNQIIQFKSFYVIINFINLILEQEKKYHIYFNFFQYVKFYEISKYSSKINFLSNFLEINNELNTLNFNFRAFDEFDINNWLDNIKKFSGEKYKNIFISDDYYREFDLFSKKINIEFRKPKWSIIRLEKRNEITRTWEIGKELEKDFIDSIVNSSSDSWTNLLNECLKKLNEPIPDLPKILIKKKTKKKGNRSNTNSATSKRRKSKSRTKSNFPKI